MTTVVSRGMRESLNTQPPGLCFRAVMTEGSTQMNFCGEGFDQLGEVST
jgi:hypothetical protein